MEDLEPLATAGREGTSGAPPAGLPLPVPTEAPERQVTLVSGTQVHRLDSADTQGR